MPPSRRGPRRKTATVSSRVYRLASVDKWDALIEKSKRKKLVVVQFYQTSGASAWMTGHIRTAFARMSAKNEFRTMLFAEVDVDQLDDVAKMEGVSSVPAYKCYWQGDCVATYVGSAPEKLADFLEENARTYTSGSAIMRTIVRVAAAGLLLAGAGYLGKSMWRTGGGSETLSFNEQMVDIKKRIALAHQKMKSAERLNKMKAVAVQRKLIERLEAQLRGMERRKERKPTSSSKESADTHSEQKKSKVLDVDMVARIRCRKAAGQVLYSDEEDILESVDSGKAQVL